MHGPRSGFELHGPPVDAAQTGKIVKQAFVGDGQTDILAGGRVVYEQIGMPLRGYYNGSIIYDATLGTLTRADGSSWLDDGFLEGQNFKITGFATLLKVQALSGTDPSKVDVYSRSWPIQPPRSRMWAAARSTPS